jgi:hypothetical protein
MNIITNNFQVLINKMMVSAIILLKNVMIENLKVSHKLCGDLLY